MSASTPHHDESETTELVVREGSARLVGSMDARLAQALAALPGVVSALPGASWALRLGPGRARSLTRVAEALALAMDERSRATLEEIAAAGNPLDPVIEMTTEGGRWLSLMDDWAWLWAEELKAIPGCRPQPDAGRFEVPLTPWTATAIEATVATHGLRLSPACELCLREALGGPAKSSDSAGTGEDAQFDVSMPASAHVVLAADPVGPLAPRISGLPGARSLGRGVGRWILVASPEAARAIRELADAVPELTFDEASERWVREAPRWIAHVEIDASSREPRICVTTGWGDPPDALERTLGGVIRHASRHLAPLSVANLRALREVAGRESELTYAPSAETSLDWLEENPDAPRVPPAELDVVMDPSGPRFVVDAIWDEAVESEFVAQEASLLRSAGAAQRSRGELPAAEWPPDALARFIRIHGVALTPAARSLIGGATVDDADAQRLLQMSSADDAELEVEGLGGELMPFQRAGVAYALERRRVFLADEQGLGKTIQALATLQADSAYPAVVVSPASLKLNWLREIAKWLPGRNTQSLSGRRAAKLAGADIVVVNYEIVGAHLGALSALAPRALILDESHYVKNPRAARTRAVLELSDRLAPDALRLALTGTPVVNRPAELAPQLRALDRLGEYGSIASFNRGFSSPGSRRRLHSRLRSSCYLRRRKRDVLEQLPAKRRAVVTIPISNEGEYRRAERDFIRWLSGQVAADGSGRIAPTVRAEALVKMTALRRLAAHGKLDAATSWIADFSQSEERLLVFAHHRQIQDAVIERFPESARIVGSDSIEERERNVERFQAEDGPQLCVCSLEVAAHGFTLTAAANVAFLELAWTPAKHDQAEDRTHRIGQDRSVTAWYLLAAGTIDERIATLLAEKRDVVDSVTDGGEGGGSSLAEALIGGYAAEG